MKKICIIGLTAQGGLGTYEQQLGNAAILIPLVQYLHKYIPDGEISTTIQLSNEFCEKYGIIRIERPITYLPRSLHQIIDSIFCFILINFWFFSKKYLKLNLKSFLRPNKIQNFIKYEIFLDFHGDILPNDSTVIPIFIHCIDILIIKRLNIPVIEFANSPGPFFGILKTSLSKIIFNNTTLILNREPFSTELIKEIGIRTPIITTACPAFLLTIPDENRIKEMLINEGIYEKDRPFIGFTLAGYNLFSFRRWDKFPNFNDLKVYIPILKYLLNVLDAKVLLIPHVYRTNPWSGEFIQGPDYMILKQLYTDINGDTYNGRLKFIKGIYTTSEIKAIIGQCDLFIGGRMHACIAAVSQCIPTIFLAYGIKHFGMAKHVGLEKYVTDGKNPEITLAIVQEAWQNKEKIKKSLNNRIIKIKTLSELNFEIIRDILDLDPIQRLNPPVEIINRWKDLGD